MEPNGHPDGPGEVQVDAGVVAQTLAQRLGQREAEHSWELAVRDARIADLTRQLAAAHELIENARAQRDAQTDPADDPDHEEVPADA